MSQLKNYYRPDNLDEALRLLSPETAILAGGTYLNAHLPEMTTTVVDLQSIKISDLLHTKGGIKIGAMAKLSDIMKYAKMPTLIREMTRLEGPNTMRNMATIGGVIAGADKDSELLAALLVYQANITLHTVDGSQVVSLIDFLADVPRMLHQAIITEVSLPHFEDEGRTAYDRVARTPTDAPIVSAVARLDQADTCYVALCGVAETPILVNPDDLSKLKPPADFRGSTAYRLAMAETLTQRVLNEVRHEN